MGCFERSSFSRGSGAHVSGNERGTFLTPEARWPSPPDILRWPPASQNRMTSWCKAEGTTIRVWGNYIVECSHPLRVPEPDIPPSVDVSSAGNFKASRESPWLQFFNTLKPIIKAQMNQVFRKVGTTITLPILK